MSPLLSPLSYGPNFVTDLTQQRSLYGSPQIRSMSQLNRISELGK